MGQQYLGYVFSISGECFIVIMHKTGLPDCGKSLFLLDCEFKAIAYQNFQNQFMINVAMN